MTIKLALYCLMPSPSLQSQHELKITASFLARSNLLLLDIPIVKELNIIEQ